MYRNLFLRYTITVVMVLLALTASLTNASASFLEFSCTSVTEIPQAECLALVALYNSAGGDSWFSNANWLISNTPSNWSRVSVTDGHVTALNMDYNHMIGTIPTELGVLTHMTRLSFRGNQLEGRIPAELGNITSLQILLLDSNYLSGSYSSIDKIPHELGNLTNLVILDLSNNYLVGGIPAELGNLIHLTDLDLSYNGLSGSIPNQLANLTSLEELILSSNTLSGSIPAWLGNLSQLQALYLNSNKLTGSIPTELGNLTNLTGLALAGNELTGGIPAELGNLTNLIGLYLYSNPQLSGSIPASFTNLIQLADFNFTNTGLCEPTDVAFLNWKAGVATWQGTSSCLSISGRVTDPEGAGLAGVSVSAQVVVQPGLAFASSTTTDANGYYTLSDIATGVYELRFVKAGYIILPKTVEVTNANLTEQDVAAALPSDWVYLPMLRVAP